MTGLDAADLDCAPLSDFEVLYCTSYAMTLEPPSSGTEHPVVTAEVASIFVMDHEPLGVAGLLAVVVAVTQSLVRRPPRGVLYPHSNVVLRPRR